jgi:hypothetical protein
MFYKTEGNYSKKYDKYKIKKYQPVGVEPNAKNPTGQCLFVLKE